MTGVCVKIAIVSMQGLFPGASDVTALWDNIKKVMFQFLLLRRQILKAQVRNGFTDARF